MKKPYEIIQELESDNSRLAKEKVIRCESDADNVEFFRGCRAALDSMITFGVKKVQEKQGPGAGLDAEVFWSVAQALAERQLTGNAAVSEINRIRELATEQEWNLWYRRILIKDLRCGVSEKTVNANCCERFQVPVFSCQLAHDGANHESKIRGRRLIETKLDGVRVLTVVYPDGRVDQYSRNGKELVNFDHIKQQFAKTVTGITEPVVFDGEIMSSSFQDLMKQVHRKSDVKANDAVLHLFDFLPLKDFHIGYWDRPQIQRSQKLQGWKDLWLEETPNIEILSHEEVDLDSQEGQTRFSEINANAIRQGFEGIMIKDPQAPYECKRSVSWLKQKPFLEVSLEVKDVEEGTGKNLGRMGALVCFGFDDGREISVNVGSGFSDSLRLDVWADVGSVIGSIVEVRADAVTQNQDGTYSLRFPRFLRFRGFVPGEKI
jgi:DNA ligase 1